MAAQEAKMAKKTRLNEKQHNQQSKEQGARQEVNKRDESIPLMHNNSKVLCLKPDVEIHTIEHDFTKDSARRMKKFQLLVKEKLLKQELEANFQHVSKLQKQDECVAMENFGEKIVFDIGAEVGVINKELTWKEVLWLKMRLKSLILEISGADSIETDLLENEDSSINQKIHCERDIC